MLTRDGTITLDAVRSMTNVNINVEIVAFISMLLHAALFDIFLTTPGVMFIKCICFKPTAMDC